MGGDGRRGWMYPFGPVLGVTSSVAPWALGLLPTPGLADWAWVVAAIAVSAVSRVGLRMAIVVLQKVGYGGQELEMLPRGCLE